MVIHVHVKLNNCLTPLQEPLAALIMELSYFALEVWIKYGIAVPIMLARFALRLHTPGWRNFDGTDIWCALSTVGLASSRVSHYITKRPGTLYYRDDMRLLDEHTCVPFTLKRSYR